MAREFKLPKGEKLVKASGGGTTKYAWDEWFSGKPPLVLIEQSDVDDEGNLTGAKRDFEVSRDSMVPKIKTAARRRYKVVDVYKSVRGGVDPRDHKGTALPNNGLILQPRDMTPEERQAEDLLRAEEREERKAKILALRNASATASPAQATA